MLGKLTWARFGLIWFAGWAIFACTQEAGEPVLVGTAQVELRSDLVLSETPASSTQPGQPNKPMPTARHIHVSELSNDLQDRVYHAVERYEFLPALLEQPGSRKNFTQDNTRSQIRDQHGVRTGKGFGVEAMVSSGSIHPDDASYYLPSVAFKPYFKTSESTAEPVKGLKTLIFHHKATGFPHEPPADGTSLEHVSISESRSMHPPLPERPVSLKPRTRVTWIPAKNRLDLLNGNKDLNRDRFYKLR